MREFSQNSKEVRQKMKPSNGQKTFVCRNNAGVVTCAEVANGKTIVARSKNSGSSGSSSASSSSSSSSSSDCECYNTGTVPMRYEASRAAFQNPWVPVSGAEILAVRAKIMSDSRFLALPVNPAPPARASTVFVSTTLQEPQKADAKNFQPGDLCKRISQTLIYINPTNTTYQVLTDLAPPYNIISFEKVHILPPMGAGNNTDSLQFASGEMEAMFAANPCYCVSGSARIACECFDGWNTLFVFIRYRHSDGGRFQVLRRFDRRLRLQQTLLHGRNL